MSQSEKPGGSHKPTFSRAIKEEVLQYFQDQGGSVKETAIYIHFALEHHEEIPDILEAFMAEGLITHKAESHLTLTEKGKKILARLHDRKC